MRNQIVRILSFFKFNIFLNSNELIKFNEKSGRIKILMKMME